MPNHAVHSVITDPPADVPIDIWREILRILKPGGHMLSFATTRTYHRMVIAIEDAGFEIRDQIGWLNRHGILPIMLARKPLIGTVEANVRMFGTGAINIDESRVPFVSEADRTLAHTNALGPVQRFKTTKKIMEGGRDNAGFADTHDSRGRWPANMIHDGSDEVMTAFACFGQSKSPDKPVKQGGHHRHDVGLSGTSRDGFGTGYGDVGTAARFFYCATDHTNLLQYLGKLITPHDGVMLNLS